MIDIVTHVFDSSVIALLGKPQWYKPVEYVEYVKRNHECELCCKTRYTLECIRSRVRNKTCISAFTFTFGCLFQTLSRKHHFPFYFNLIKLIAALPTGMTGRSHARRASERIASRSFPAGRRGSPHRVRRSLIGPLIASRMDVDTELGDSR